MKTPSGATLIMQILVSAFLAILILRAHLLAPVDPNRVICAAATLPSALAAKSLPLRPGF